MGLSMTVARGVGGTISNVGEGIRAKNSENGFEEKKERRSACACACACVSRLGSGPEKRFLISRYPTHYFWNAANCQLVGLDA